jgi:hypothetical protein
LNTTNDYEDIKNINTYTPMDTKLFNFDIIAVRLPYEESGESRYIANDKYYPARLKKKYEDGFDTIPNEGIQPYVNNKNYPITNHVIVPICLECQFNFIVNVLNQPKFKRLLDNRNIDRLIRLTQLLTFWIDYSVRDCLSLPSDQWNNKIESILENMTDNVIPQLTDLSTYLDRYAPVWVEKKVTGLYQILNSAQQVNLASQYKSTILPTYTDFERESIAYLFEQKPVNKTILNSETLATGVQSLKYEKYSGYLDLDIYPNISTDLYKYANTVIQFPVVSYYPIQQYDPLLDYYNFFVRNILFLKRI